MPSTTTDRPKTPLPTEPERPSVRTLQLARIIRRVAIALLALFVGIALFGGFGYRTGTISTSGGGFRLDLRYPAIARPGQSVQWILSIHRDGGLPESVQVATTVRYLDTFDFNDIEPSPDAATTDATDVTWTFTAPPGEDMTIFIDALVATQVWRGADARTSVVEDGVPVATLAYATRIAP
jgi:hypothetical protein